ncbi:hypothetical protein BU16DRAFT_559867 [Lophium mytilinum]|uniref:Uncharacterized protein n=1 Tax=Lophium mytilinum TaxID=390894 RepID=A0A6A6QWL9_9PEZI|nr:hypothetical protein BU16DRAFT_559867 [Lophium mytilinum]
MPSHLFHGPHSSSSEDEWERRSTTTIQRLRTSSEDESGGRRLSRSSTSSYRRYFYRMARPSYSSTPSINRLPPPHHRTTVHRPPLTLFGSGEPLCEHCLHDVHISPRCLASHPPRQQRLYLQARSRRNDKRRWRNWFRKHMLPWPHSQPRQQGSREPKHHSTWPFHRPEGYVTEWEFARLKRAERKRQEKLEAMQRTTRTEEAERKSLHVEERTQALRHQRERHTPHESPDRRPVRRGRDRQRASRGSAGSGRNFRDGRMPVSPQPVPSLSPPTTESQPSTADLPPYSPSPPSYRSPPLSYRTASPR